MDQQGDWAANCLPIERLYDSQEALFKAIQEWAKPRGYAFVIGRSTYQWKRKKITYTCDRACKPADPSKLRRRQTTTRGTNCPFSVLAKQQPDMVTWALIHRPDPSHGAHNHPPSLHSSAHPSYRTLSTSDQIAIQDLTNARVPPRSIRTYLRQNSATLATHKDISNQIMKARHGVLEGQSNIQALVTQLDTEGFWSRIQLNEITRQVTAVMFAHPQSLSYLQAYPDTILLDCTYKTNKYGMPLLDIIGIDACGRSFCVAFAFISGEAEEDYCWVLERLRSIFEASGSRLPSVILTDRDLALRNAVAREFPQAACLLCLWHANKAVTRHCLPTFTRQNFNTEITPEKQQD